MRHVAQIMFERALGTARVTLDKLKGRPPALQRLPRRELMDMIADLESLTRALYTELNERDGR